MIVKKSYIYKLLFLLNRIEYILSYVIDNNYLCLISVNFDILKVIIFIIIKCAVI